MTTMTTIDSSSAVFCSGCFRSSRLASEIMINLFLLGVTCRKGGVYLLHGRALSLYSIWPSVSVFPMGDITDMTSFLMNLVLFLGGFLGLLLVYLGEVLAVGYFRLNRHAYFNILF